MTKTPMTIIAGFLGSGKTSLLNHLLTQSEGRNITALVNDFGALNIDAELIAAQQGNQIELTNGCVCCSIGDDLMRALAEIMRQSPAPDHIIIEASGVADPARIAAYAAVDPQLRLDGIVTLVDAAAHNSHKDDPYLAENYANQINAAHMLLIAKSDIADKAETEAIEAELMAAHPNVPQARVIHGQLPIDVILGLRGTMPTPRPQPLETHGLTSWSGHLHGGMRRAELANKIKQLRPHVLRAKGVLHDDDGTYVLHYAGGRINFEPFDGTPSGHFVLIGKPDMPDAQHLTALFDA